MKLIAIFPAAVLCSLAAAALEKNGYDNDFLFEEDDWKDKKEKPAVKTWIWDPESGLCSALACHSTEMCLLEDSFTAVCVSRAELKTNGDRIISRQLAEDEHLIKTEPWSDEEDELTEEEEEDEEDEINLDEQDEDEEDYDYDEDDEEEEDDDEEADRKMKEEEKKEKECRECPYTHPTVSAYLCATDNRTYSSVCRLEQHNCIHETLVTADCKGFCPCKESGTYQRRSQKSREATPRHQETFGGFGKSSKAKLKAKYDKYQKDRKGFNNVKYYPKTVEQGSKHQPKCSRSDLESMAARLADWFVVIKSTNGGTKPNYKHHKYYSTHFPSSCRPMSQWMFLYLDTDSDGQLTQRELYAVERDEHEPCLKPFLDSCDLNSDIFLTTREWCTCFKSVPSPCRDRRQDDATRPGAYMPSCDGDGFFRPTQCHGSKCWCADRYGVEQKGTRSRRGSTKCDGNTARYDADFNVADEDDEDNYVIDGSGSGPLLEF